MGDYYTTDGDTLMAFILLSALYFCFLSSYNMCTEQYLQGGISPQSPVWCSLSLLLFFSSVVSTSILPGRLPHLDILQFLDRDKILYLRCNRLAFPIRSEFIQTLCLIEAEKSCSSFMYLCSFLSQHLFRSC